MRQLVGDDRRAIADQLVAGFDRVIAGEGPLAVSLEASLGLGKTRLVQELYHRLATTRQGTPAYWPPTLDWRVDAVGQARPDVLQARKQVEPTPGWVIPGGAELPWLWWGISCQLTHAGSPMRAMKDASDQLRAHLDPMLQKLQRSNRNRDDALELLSGVFDLAGVVNPGAALDAVGKFLSVFRRRADQQRDIQTWAMDRRVEDHGESHAEAKRVADGLTAVARAKTPVVLVVDDAHWADPGLVSLLRYLIGLESAAVLIVTTAWPEKLASTVGQGAETFAAWLSETAAIRPGRLQRVPFHGLDVGALSQIVMEAASRTEPAAAMQIARLASGSPLVLNLQLDLDLIRQDIAADGRIDTDPAKLARVPSSLVAIYQDLWRQLPGPVQRVLAMVAVQGHEFLPGFVSDAASRIGMHAELVPAFAAARDQHHWIRAVNDDRYEFADRLRFEIAYDLTKEVLDDAVVDLVRGAIVDDVVALKASSRWAELDTQTRRIALSAHLDLNEQLGEGASRDLLAVADSGLQLAALELDSGATGRAIELTEQAVGIFGQDEPDVASLRRAKELLAQALTAAGRPGDAAPILIGLAAGSTSEAPGLTSAAAMLTELAAQARPTSPAIPVSAAVSGPSAGEASDEWGRLPWRAWPPRAVPPLVDLPPSALAELIREVVEVEGSVYAGRVYDLLRAASGAGRQGRIIRTALDSGVRAAIRRGEVVASVPDARGASERRVLRLPTQPEVLVRQLGERTAADVPKGEIAELARRVAAREPGLARDELKRRLAPLLGAKVLTKGLDELLEFAIPMSLAMAAGPVPVASEPQADALGRLPWVGWTPAAVPALVGLKPAEVAVQIQAVVAGEGPVTMGRVSQVLRKASGAPRATRALDEAIEAGLASAVRRGDLVVAPGRRRALETRVVRLPSQLDVVLRTPGDRDAAEIPRSELAELGRRVMAQNPTMERAQVKRELARLLGWGRYTASIDDLLESAIPMDPITEVPE